ncbi:MAG TPA: hypothetical protein VHH54_00255 [Actinomycetota bacterium]|nr:hypothetical protein [Actinomycetota bacterium]
MRLALLAFDRENVIIAALAALMVAGLVVSVGAAVLLRRDRGGERKSDQDRNEPTSA